jgi:hypothetical protein
VHLSVSHYSQNKEWFTFLYSINRLQNEDGACLLRDMKWIIKCNSEQIYSSRWRCHGSDFLPWMTGWIPGKFCGGLGDDEMDISQSTPSIFHSQHNSTNAP